MNQKVAFMFLGVIGNYVIAQDLDYKKRNKIMENDKSSLEILRTKILLLL